MGRPYTAQPSTLSLRKRAHVTVDRAAVAPRARDETAPRAGLPVLYTLGVNSRAARRKDESVLVKGIRGLLLRAARVECKELLHVDDAIFDECVRVG